MSATFDWSWVFVMDQSLYTQLRNTIYSKIVPSTINNVPYDGYTITQLIFSTLQTTVNVDPNNKDTLIIKAPIKGTLTTNSTGNQDSFNGTVTLSVFLDYIFIAPCPGTVSFASDDGATWSNCMNITSASAFSAPSVALTQGSSNTQSVLTSFFQEQINDYVASSPNSLGTMTAQNLPQYFAPTYQQLITLTGGPNDPRVLLLAMVNGDAPPTGDQNSDFENSPLLVIPTGADSVAAFDDYTLYEYVAQQMEASSKSPFDSITVSQDPAVLTAKLTKDNFSGTLTSQIANNAIQTSFRLTNSNTANFSYATTVTLINNSDGSQSVEIKNDLTNCSITVNQDSPVVITIYAIMGMLVLASPLAGAIFWAIVNTIEYYIRQMLTNLAHKVEFDTTKPTKGKVELISITLNGGVVLATDLSQIPTDVTTTAVSPSPQIVYAPLPQPQNLQEALSYFSKGVDAMHDNLSTGAQPRRRATHP